MVYCAIVGCDSSSNRDESKGISFFRVPRIEKNRCDKTLRLSTERRTKWLRAINRKETSGKKGGKKANGVRTPMKRGCYFNPETARVCGKHFHSGKASALFDEDHIDWVPTLHLAYLNASPEADAKRKRSMELEAARYQRKQLRKEKAKSAQPVPETIMEQDPSSTEPALVPSTVDPPADEVEHIVPLPKFSEISTQTDLTMSDFDKLEFTNRELKAQNELLGKHILKLTPLSEEALQQDTNLVKFYTGLPSFAMLVFVYDLISPYVKSVNTGSKKFSEFLMFMIRIRLNLPMQDIAFRFGVSKATSSRYFEKWLEAAYVRLNPFVRWPTREELKMSCPSTFKAAFGDRIAVIIDCFEVFIERPSSLNARASTWSYYKNNNTAKYLIGITPRGLISFISNGWGGRTSDKHITEHCGILDKLLPGDVVMADRGFNIAEVLGVNNTSLLIPSFTKGLNQLAPHDIERSRKISNLRIHVERVIGLARQRYSMLSSKIPIQLLKASQGDVCPLDKIVLVACSLCNMTNSIVTGEINETTD